MRNKGIAMFSIDADWCVYGMYGLLKWAECTPQSINHLPIASPLPTFRHLLLRARRLWFPPLYLIPKPKILKDRNSVHQSVQYTPTATQLVWVILQYRTYSDVYPNASRHPANPATQSTVNQRSTSPSRAWLQRSSRFGRRKNLVVLWWKMKLSATM
jgi:hypothetical protein